MHNTHTVHALTARLWWTTSRG